jgi:hypothetical protein
LWEVGYGNTNFNNISFISLQSVLLVKETGENHWHWKIITDKIVYWNFIYSTKSHNCWISSLQLKIMDPWSSQTKVYEIWYLLPLDSAQNDYITGLESEMSELKLYINSHWIVSYKVVIFLFQLQTQSALLQKNRV